MPESIDPAAENGAGDTSPSDNLPPRRRRAASRPAGPPAASSAEPDAPVVSEPVQPVEAVGATGVTSGEDAAPPRRRRRASSPAGTPQAAEPAPPSEPSVPEEEEEVVAEETAVEPEPEQAPAPRTRRRATRATATPAAEPASASVEAVEEASSAETPEEAPAPRRRRRATRTEAPAEAAEPTETGTPSVTEAPEEAPAPRRRRRAAEAPAESRPEAAAQDAEAAPEASSETGTEAEAEKPAGRRRAPRKQLPPVAVFQAPVFAEPVFQTPQTAAAEQAAARTDDEEEQPEAAPRRRRRRREDSAAAEAPAVETGETAEAAEAAAEAPVEEGADDDESGERPSRRRRRGGRRRRRGEGAEDSAEETQERTEEETSGGSEESAEDAGRSQQGSQQEEKGDEDAEGDEDDTSSSSSRRRRRRRRRSGDSAEPEASGADDPERTVVKVREPRRKKDAEPSDEVQSIKGSTRLEAKKQRRREGREQGRRRVPIITEAEFLARREAVERVMVVRQQGERTQIGVLEDGVLVEHFVNKEQSTSYVGNVYLGKVQNVLPSMEAAFVDIGKGRNAVLYAGEVNFEALGVSGGPRRIEVALKSGQPVLVQVTKDPIGHKGARLTSQVSLPGRYLVYVPEGSMTGISRKLPDTERARLKSILKKVVPEDAGVIVRTAAEGASEDELRRDVERLQAQWEDIRKKAEKGNAPTLLYGEPDMTVRVVRDIFNEDFSKVIVSGDRAWETVHGYVSHVAPDLAERLQRWTSETDVFAVHRIDEQLSKALDRKVWLPSGGSLVIDRTEAMIVVDVNTGKFTGQGGNLEETVTRNNLEAAEEIVRQLRLRDLGGIIVIDFIDMVLESNRDLVLRRLLECLGRDRTKHQVAEVTSLGLVQMTRKRVGQGLLESFSEPCVHCNGRGLVVHLDHQGAGPVAVAAAAQGGGKKGKRKQKAAEAEAVDTVEGAEDVEQSGTETAAEVAAETAAPLALPEPAFVPDEELYSSAAEAEAAASRGGRAARRRGGRRAAAPAGPPAVTEPEREPARSESVVTESARSEPAVSEPAGFVQGPSAGEAAPARPRRRASRRAGAPAGSPTGTEAQAAAIVLPASDGAAVAEAPEPAVVTVPGVDEEPAPARPRRRATRAVSAPAADAPSTDGEEPPADGADGAEEAPAPAKKAVRKKAAVKKTAAKKATTAKKTAAKKTTAKKAVAKKATTARKKAAAADEPSEA